MQNTTHSRIRRFQRPMVFAPSERDPAHVSATGHCDAPSRMPTVGPRRHSHLGTSPIFDDAKSPSHRRSVNADRAPVRCMTRASSSIKSMKLVLRGRRDVERRPRGRRIATIGYGERHGTTTRSTVSAINQPTRAIVCETLSKQTTDEVSRRSLTGFDRGYRNGPRS